jgi:hypothetical protein
VEADFHLMDVLRRPANYSLTWLAGGNGRVPCLLRCAIMSRRLPEPPGS